MNQKARAVVCRELNQPVVVEDIVVEAPRRNEVMIKLAACGVCHSDLSATNGTIAFPPPLVLGHEGAGTVVQVGEGVSALAVGDTVLSSFVSMCGKCRYCVTGRPQLCDQAAKALFTLPDGSVRTRDAAGNALNVFSGCGVMAEYATLHVDNLVKVEPGVPLDRCALVGCGVMTGVGAVCNTAKVEAGSIAIVFGAGGVGLNAIQGCVLSGAAMIVAVDLSDAKLELARTFGATHVVNAGREENIVKTLRKLTGGGADYAFECIGQGEVRVAREDRDAREIGDAPAPEMEAPMARPEQPHPIARRRDGHDRRQREERVEKHHLQHVIAAAEQLDAGVHRGEHRERAQGHGDPGHGSGRAELGPLGGGGHRGSVRASSQP